MTHENINTHITTLEEIVPIDIRLTCYIKAKEFVKQSDTIDKTHGLCLLFPMMLWNLKHYGSSQPNGKDWNYNDASIAFPELTEKIIDRIQTGITFEQRNKIRLYYLNKWIKKLTPKDE